MTIFEKRLLKYKKPELSTLEKLEEGLAEYLRENFNNHVHSTGVGPSGPPIVAGNGIGNHIHASGIGPRIYASTKYESI